ncbi:MAG TPA: glucosamine-6-phosphate deaminase, partial [bacterium]|nr:glucosamine-6-phosphate deaminase [bacterium]
MRKYDYSSTVESLAIKQSGYKENYPPEEKLRVLVVSDFPTLGKITALRFIEWCQKNPGGVISLPTGKTPEYFIYWTSLILKKWEDKKVKKLLEQYNLDLANKPEIASFIFVQIDEFFPVNPEHENSFISYIKKFYIKKLGLDEKKALLMDTWTASGNPGINLGEVFPDGKVDLSLRYRHPLNTQEQLQQKLILEKDQYAMEYEQKIREMGGIGFFLGGIGPDGHIGFNIKGSDHFSTTRLIPINYETAAAAASDLGGIEVSRDKIVMTVGLGTICFNPTSCVIIIAAGESKASVIKNAIMNEPSILYPATVLGKLPGACFFLTSGASKLLTEREIIRLNETKKIPEKNINQIIIDIATKLNKRLRLLTISDFLSDKKGAVVINKGIDVEKTIQSVETFLIERIEKGTKNIGNITFLHTAPHHDDIMLGYMPYIIHLVRNPSNKHYFATLTSGFTSVTNAYVVRQLEKLEDFLKTHQCKKLMAEGYFTAGNNIFINRDVYHYLDGVAANSIDIQNEASARRLLRNIISMIKTEDISAVKKKISRFINYFENSYPGKKDIHEVQTLKGMKREWEEELL